MAADYKIENVNIVRLKLQDRLAAWLHSSSTSSQVAYLRNR